MHPSTRRELGRLAADILPPPLRSIRQFAEDEIIIPDGPREGERFRCGTQPYVGLWFDELASGRWRRFVATGPTQTGKTLACWVIPILYHLFELRETVICGIPTMEMANDKWTEDLLPAIERSRYRELLPRSGEGSRGGQVKRGVQFRHGPTLRFMSGGGGDEKRSGFTARVVIVTEADKLDDAGEQSREADKLTQLEQRIKSYGRRGLFYLEGTPSIESGRTWREYVRGSTSRLIRPCPHCHQWVTPDRPDLVGWQDAATDTEAADLGRIACPSCRATWSEEERDAANRQSRLIHRGQEVLEDGTVAGELPQTQTLGFRWSAADNLFQSMGDVAAEEWRAARDPDQENAERGRLQFGWALPAPDIRKDLTDLDATTLTHRVGPEPRGVRPDRSTLVTVGVDVGKYLVHWVATAWSDGARGQVIDYGRIEVPSVDLGVERGILSALRQLRDQVDAGWPDAAGELLEPELAWVDSGYQGERDSYPVYAFCGQDPRWQPTKGFGRTAEGAGLYARPRRTSKSVARIGEGWHVVRLSKPRRVKLVELDADHWKTWLHERLQTPLGKAGALTFFKAAPSEHLAFAKHLTAERRVESFKASTGLVVRWERIHRNNHWLDALSLSCAAASAAGVHLLGEHDPLAPPETPRPARKAARTTWFKT